MNNKLRNAAVLTPIALIGWPMAKSAAVQKMMNPAWPLEMQQIAAQEARANLNHLNFDRQIKTVSCILIFEPYGLCDMPHNVQFDGPRPSL